jgi:hypothetical protein
VQAASALAEIPSRSEDAGSPLSVQPETLNVPPMAACSLARYQSRIIRYSSIADPRMAQIRCRMLNVIVETHNATP